MAKGSLLRVQCYDYGEHADREVCIDFRLCAGQLLGNEQQPACCANSADSSSFQTHWHIKTPSFKFHASLLVVEGHELQAAIKCAVHPRGCTWAPFRRAKENASSPASAADLNSSHFLTASLGLYFLSTHSLQRSHLQAA